MPLAGPSPSLPTPDPLGPFAAGDASEAEVAARLERIAHAWIGTPYRRGGQDANGIDCSALARAVLAELGVPLPRTTADQRRTGTQVARDDVAPGDLVFFRLGSRRVNHVGVALDADRFLHASTTRGVVLESLEGTYFGRRFVEARRVSGD
jgi:cell wall-associated NlpC family hydrolase